MIEFEKAILEWDLTEESYKKIKSAMGLNSDESILCWRPNLVLGPLSDKRVNDPGNALDLNKRHGESTLRSKSIGEIFKVIHDGQPISNKKIDKICHLLRKATTHHKQKVGGMTLDMDTSMWTQVIGKKQGYIKQECSS
ncbi:hypothetical protein [Endozoicomonas sp. Mp262]|uniref:hypothetical protein n=1 Tax=Endozoicomonas sp. Mp262 TaxID=2919499 RepID=UPI0021DAAEB7